MNAHGPLPTQFVTLHDPSLLPFLSNRTDKNFFGLIPPQGVGRVMGWNWWRALTCDSGMLTVFDADDGAGLAAYALRQGQTWVVCACQSPTIDTLRDLARQCGGHILQARPKAFDQGPPPYKAYHLEQLRRYLTPGA